ncbi:MAG: radical SAM protein [Candidatus Velamenicoccus archaeovorus]
MNESSDFVFHDRLDPFRLEAARRKRPAVGPRSVNIHLTNLCNLRCIFCWEKSPLVIPKDRRIRHMDFQLLKKTIQDCARIGTTGICLEGGETMLYPRIKELILFIKHLGLRLEVYSNCAVETALMRYLALADKVNVNLSAADPRNYSRIHGPRAASAFRKTLGNICALTQNKKRHPLVQMIFIINEMNYEDIPRALVLAKNAHASEVKFKLIEATAQTRSLLLSDNGLQELKAFLKDFRPTKDGVKTNLEEIRRAVLHPGFMKNRKSLRKSAWHNDRLFYFKAFHEKRMPCYVGWFYGFIDLDGRVVAPCDNVGVAIMGNIHETPFSKIWFSKRFERLRAAARQGTDPKKKLWQECRYCGFAAFNKSVCRTLKEM